MSRLFPIDDRLSSADGWYTPEWVFDGLGLMFDLDVAAPADGRSFVPCRTWYSETDDGLAQPWRGVVWCNPPYSAPTKWCNRYAQHPDAIILLRADLSTGGPFRAVAASDAIYVAPRRIEFVNRTGGASETSSVTFTSVLLARGQQCVDALYRLAAVTGGITRRLIH